MRQKRENRSLNRGQSLSETLESRRLLSADVWSGAGGNNLFSNGANWQGNVAPVSGQDVQFNALGTPQTVDVDSAVTVGAVTIAGNYTFSDQELTISGNVTASASASATFSNTVGFAANSTYNIGTGATLTLNAIDDSSVHTLTKTGAGNLVFDSPDTSNWLMQAGVFTINVSNTNNSEMNITQSGGVITTAQTSGGEIVAGSLDQTAGTLNTGSVYFSFSGQVTLDDTLEITFNGASNGYGGVNSHGSPALILGANSQLKVDYGSSFQPTVGDTYYPLDINGPIQGFFSNVPDNSTADLTGVRYSTADYENEYLTVAVVGSYPDNTLTASSTSVQPNQSVTLTDTLAGTLGTPTGTVTFTENSVVLGTSSVTNGVAQLVVPSFAIGTHPIIATYSGDSTYLTKASSTLSISSANGSMVTLAHGPTATSSGPKTASLSTNASDSVAQLTGSLTYTWSLLHAPSGAKTPVFSANGSHAASAISAQLFKAGTYTFQVTVTDTNGHSATSAAQYVAAQHAHTLRLTPHAQRLQAGSSTQVGATVLDQFDHPMLATAPATYSVLQGSGTISSSGIYRAGDKKGHVVIRVTLDDLTGTIGATIV